MEIHFSFSFNYSSTCSIGMAFEYNHSVRAARATPLLSYSGWGGDEWDASGSRRPVDVWRRPALFALPPSAVRLQQPSGFAPGRQDLLHLTSTDWGRSADDREVRAAAGGQPAAGGTGSAPTVPIQPSSDTVPRLRSTGAMLGERPRQDSGLYRLLCAVIVSRSTRRRIGALCGGASYGARPSGTAGKAISIRQYPSTTLNGAPRPSVPHCRSTPFSTLCP